MPYLVRHAHAGDKRTWAGPDLLRPLSGPGRREANGLLTQLRNCPVAKVLSSPAVRCLQTVEPLAARRGLPVECAEVLGVDADPDGLVDLLLDPAAAEAVVCSHGELIGGRWSGWSVAAPVRGTSWCGPRARPGSSRWPAGRSGAIATFPRCACPQLRPFGGAAATRGGSGVGCLGVTGVASRAAHRQRLPMPVPPRRPYRSPSPP
jgi:hypothetical protein